MNSPLGPLAVTWWLAVTWSRGCAQGLLGVEYVDLLLGQKILRNMLSRMIV